ncbi:LysM peptidoglycan-binding domain-containing protein [Acidimicrobiaceae bacterium]|jgi:LysM repeat protein|nr:LysM peptidoglycan-binding domain-containing protein [Acidimicrobiaceae bacterium]MDA9713049.1 LysM peptidoglycan-binding domain-containing protein [Acidimicrobiaceae bacterium]MDA9756695.1 LysM peptidoglycan-binding domain-containing protein [Acidimicrobiaceae bacterium]|tara:strand:+ start:341 stop:598 length:258 start_codon:yes stop_codon:yes gene_type:complete
MKEKLILFTFLTIFSLITTPIIKNNSLTIPTNNGLMTYQVQKGDSLWDIGLKYDSNDIENFLFEAKKLNNLDNSTIFEDQILIIP